MYSYLNQFLTFVALLIILILYTTNSYFTENKKLADINASKSYEKCEPLFLDNGARKITTKEGLTEYVLIDSKQGRFYYDCDSNCLRFSPRLLDSLYYPCP